MKLLKRDNYLLIAGILLIVLGSIRFLPRSVKIPEIIKPSEITSVIYIYEKDDGPIPNGVSSAIEKLNREKNILASLFEEDTVDGNGETPLQFKKALEAAKIKGVPSLVILSGSDIVSVLKNPQTEKEVLESLP